MAKIKCPDCGKILELYEYHNCEELTQEKIGKRLRLVEINARKKKRMKG